MEAAPKEILGDFPRLSREKALELVYKTEAKNKGWDTLDKSKEEPQPRSAGDSFVEQQSQNQLNTGNDNNRAFEYKVHMHKVYIATKRRYVTITDNSAATS